MEERYPFAVWRPGPQDKVYGGRNAVAGVLLHSMQGDYDPGALSVLDDERTDETGQRYLAASFPFSIVRDGTVYQHYDLTATPFHAGSPYWGERLVGIEHEGGLPGNLGEPLTEAQITSSVAVVRWIARQGLWVPARFPVSVRTLHQHFEVTQTLCPSGRFDALWERYMEDEVEIRQLDFGATLKMLEASYAQFNSVALDQNGGAVAEVIAGSPLPVPAGGVALLVVVRRSVWMQV